MKKIFLILCFGLMSFVAMSQDFDRHHYCNVKTTVSTNILSSLDHQEVFGCFGTIETFSLRGEIPISEYLYLLTEGMIGSGYVKDCLYTPILLGIGIKMPIHNNWYCSMMAYPRIRVVGTGHQANGDYTTGWITFVPAIGYRYKIASNGFLFVEASVSMDITLFSQLNYYKDNCGLSFTLGYSYLIN